MTGKAIPSVGLLRKEALAYRHYNARCDNQRYFALTGLLAATSSDTDAPNLADWEWGNFLTDAALEICGHPAFEGSIISLQRCVQSIQVDERRNAMTGVFGYLYVFTGEYEVGRFQDLPTDLPF